MLSDKTILAGSHEIKYLGHNCGFKFTQLHMTIIRTSETHPLKIDTIALVEPQARIGITFCPGKKDKHAYTGQWSRDLNQDLDAIVYWGAHMVITLLEQHEFEALQVTQLGEEIKQRGLVWLHLPIRDGSVPDTHFEESWSNHRKLIDQVITKQGGSVLVHCKGGLGRAGTIAARLLVELGYDPSEAIKEVRKVRSRDAIENIAQENYILNLPRA